MSPQERFPNIKKILVIKLKHIGDVLLSTPCVRALHENFPDARISVLLNEGTEEMFRKNPLIDKIFVYQRGFIKKSHLGVKIRSEIELINEIRREGFDMVVDLTSGDRAAWTGFLSKARYRLAYDPDGAGFFGKKYFYTHRAPLPKGTDLHEVMKNLGVLGHWGIKAKEPRLELHTSDDEEQAVADELGRLGREGLKDKFVLVHPTSRWMFKCWEDERVAAIIDWIQREMSCSVILTCGPDAKEKARIDRILGFCELKPFTLLGRFSLTQWASLVKRAKVFFGVDSAPMHIAASQGTPTLALFGPTGYQNWRPWAVHHIVLVKDCPCARDRQPHCDWKRTRACMQNISVDEVKDALRNLIQSEVFAAL